MRKVFIFHAVVFLSAAPLTTFAQSAGPNLNGVIYADMKCATTGTYDDTCLTNATNQQSNVKVFLPGNADGSRRTYTFSAGWSTSNTANVELECGQNVYVQACSPIPTNCVGGIPCPCRGGGSYPSSYLFLINGASNEINLHSQYKGCKLDGTNINTSSATGTANVLIQNLEIPLSGITQGTGCGPNILSGLNPSTICGTVSTAVTNWQNICAPTANGQTGPACTVSWAMNDVYALVWNINPGYWNSAADLLNCDQMSCQVTRKGPITFADSTHFYYLADEHANINPTMSAVPGSTYIAGGLVDIGPYKSIEVSGFEAFGSPSDCVTANTYYGSFALTRDVYVHDMFIHDCHADGVRNFKVTNFKASNIVCDGQTVPTQCLQDQSSVATKFENITARQQWNSPTMQPKPVPLIRGGFTTDLQLRNPVLYGTGSQWTTGSFYPNIWFDTCLDCTIEGGDIEGASIGILYEVSRGGVVSKVTTKNTGFAGIVNRFRLDNWQLFSGNTVLNTEQKWVFRGVNTQVSVTSQPPAKFNSVTLSAGLANPPPAPGDDMVPVTGELKVNTTGFVAGMTGFNSVDNLLWCVDVPRTDGPTHPNGQGPNALTCTAGGSCTLKYTPGTNLFTTTPSYQALVDENSVTLSGTITNACLGSSGVPATHTLTAVGTSSITFPAGSCATFTNATEGATITANRLLRIDPYPLRRVFIGSPTDHSEMDTAVDGLTLAFVASSQLGCVNPEQAWPVPRFDAGSWGPIKTFLDPHFGEKTNGMQSFGMVRITSNAIPYQFDVADFKFDIFHNQDMEFNSNIVSNSFTYCFWTIGGENIGYHDNHCVEPGWGSPYGLTGSGSFRDAGTGFEIESGTGTQSFCTAPYSFNAALSSVCTGTATATAATGSHVDRLDFSGNTVEQAQSPSFGSTQPGLSYIKFNTQGKFTIDTGASITNVSVDPYGIMLSDFLTDTSGINHAFQVQNGGAAGTGTNGTVGTVTSKPIVRYQLDNTGNTGQDGAAVNMQCGIDFAANAVPCPIGTYSFKGCINVTTAATGGNYSLTLGYTSPRGAETITVLNTISLIALGPTCFQVSLRSQGTAQITKRITFGGVGSGQVYAQDLELTQETLQ
jgi:hypothetical protein